MSERALLFVRCLSNVAWADGYLLPAEAAFFRQVIEALALPSDLERDAWRAIITPGEGVDPDELKRLSDRDREQLLSLATDLADCDGDMSDAEREVVEQLRHLLADDES